MMPRQNEHGSYLMHSDAMPKTERQGHKWILRLLTGANRLRYFYKPEEVRAYYNSHGKTDSTDKNTSYSSAVTQQQDKKNKSNSKLNAIDTKSSKETKESTKEVHIASARRNVYDQYEKYNEKKKFYNNANKAFDSMGNSEEAKSFKQQGYVDLRKTAANYYKTASEDKKEYDEWYPVYHENAVKAFKDIQKSPDATREQKAKAKEIEQHLQEYKEAVDVYNKIADTLLEAHDDQAKYKANNTEQHNKLMRARAALTRDAIDLYGKDIGSSYYALSDTLNCSRNAYDCRQDMFDLLNEIDGYNILLSQDFTPEELAMLSVKKNR